MHEAYLRMRMIPEEHGVPAQVHEGCVGGV